MTPQVKREGGPEEHSNLDGDDDRDEDDKVHLGPLLAHQHRISQVTPGEVFQDLTLKGQKRDIRKHKRASKSTRGF